MRNLPYSADNFEVSIDEEKQQIVIRTKNKKFFKRYGLHNFSIDVPDLTRLNKAYKLEKAKLDWSFKNNTLVVTVDNL